MRYFFFLLLLFCCACSAYKRQSFVYSVNGQSDTLSLLVPKGYSKKSALADSAGNQELVYVYPHGGVLYFVRKAGGKEYQPIDTSRNIPRQHVQGGIFFKGINENGLFWRQVRLDSFRFGYRFVPRAYEFRFDSALNYVRVKEE